MNINFAVYDNKHNEKIEIINDISKQIEEIAKSLKANELDKAMIKLQALSNDYPIKSDLISVIDIIQRELIDKQLKRGCDKSGK